MDILKEFKSYIIYIVIFFDFWYYICWIGILRAINQGKSRVAALDKNVGEQ